MAVTGQRALSSSLPEHFAKNLRAFREAENLNSEDFAKLLGLDVPALESIEQGEHDLTLEAVEVIAATLGIEPLLLLE